MVFTKVQHFCEKYKKLCPEAESFAKAMRHLFLCGYMRPRHCFVDLPALKTSLPPLTKGNLSATICPIHSKSLTGTAFSDMYLIKRADGAAETGGRYGKSPPPPSARQKPRRFDSVIISHEVRTSFVRANSGGTAGFLPRPGRFFRVCGKGGLFVLYLYCISIRRR